MKALIFDLDGTLVDSVYPHTLAWQKTLSEFGMVCVASDIHRGIGMSGTLLVKSLARKQGRTLSEPQIEKLSHRHAQLFHELAPTCNPLPGAVELLKFLTKAKIRHGIATSGKPEEIKGALQGLSLTRATMVIDGSMVQKVKPEPDLFLLCQQKLKVKPHDCLVVGDAVWDIHAARRSSILSVGLRSGGCAEQDLYNAGAMRVYADAAELLANIDELGFEIGLDQVRPLPQHRQRHR
jgi:HAD superfamily hydrolase (TIGR01549 family)